MLVDLLDVVRLEGLSYRLLGCIEEGVDLLIVVVVRAVARGAEQATTGLDRRGADVLTSERYDPANNHSAWMPFVIQLRALAAGPRHAHPTVRPDRHTTDPAKLGKAGSETKIAPDSKPGNRTLEGKDRGYEYSIPNFSGARLIEVPREDAVNWTDASWYLSLGHYTSYKLITNLP
jgi:hypothetical protein